MSKSWNMWVYPQNAQIIQNALQAQGIQFTTTTGTHQVPRGCGCCYYTFPVVYFHIPGWSGKQFTKFLATLGIGRIPKYQHI